MSLSEVIQNYRNLRLAFHRKVPQKIIYSWSTRIAPANFYSLGEKGADAFIKGLRFSEDTLVYYAIQAETERYPEMADGFWKKAHALHLENPKSKAKRTNKTTASKPPTEQKVVTIKGKDRNALREWWHKILRTHGRYSCYAIFLTLPYDVEALRYLTSHGNELNLIAGENCLVIALSTTEFQRTGFDEGTWQKLVEEQTKNGHSVTVAQLFGIEFTKFPCLLLFQDIRSPEHIAITLTEMNAEQISTKLRFIFTVVQNAIMDKKKPLDELKKQQSIEFIKKTSRLVTSKLGELAEATFEKAMEAWIKTKIN
jgi:hypothetical protein